MRDIQGVSQQSSAPGRANPRHLGQLVLLATASVGLAALVVLAFLKLAGWL